MKNKYFLIILCAVLFFNCSDTNKDGSFTLTGKFKGNNTKSLILTYRDKNQKNVRDTLHVDNETFFASGELDGATEVSLIGNIKSRLAIDVNFVSFFLEPTNNYISLEENNFKQLKVKGSKTQKEYEDLETHTAPFYKKINALMLKRKKLIAKNTDEKNSKSIQAATIECGNNLNKIKNIRLDFVKKHPQSYLSAYWLNFYFKRISLDSAKTFYTNLNLKQRSGHYGKIIKKKIIESSNSVHSNKNDKAFNFKLSNAANKKISLESYRGKYLLLDFWASWCAPCREANPSLIKLYKAYHPKGLEVVGISSDRNNDAWKKAIQKDGIGNWQQLISGEDHFLISKNYNIKAIPAYILIDKEGYIIERYLSASKNNLGMEDLKKKLTELFNN